MTTDYRALCVELLDALESNHQTWRIPVSPLVARARAALAEPVGEGPTEEELLATLDKATADFPPRHPEAESLNAVEYPLALELRKARAVLARWGRHPAPVPEEAANPWKDALIDALVCNFLLNKENESDPKKALHDLISWELELARDLSISLLMRPVPVSERLPEPGTKVLAHYCNALGKGRTICAIWVPAKSRSDDADFADDDFTGYDEEDDKFYWPEGWYEAIENWDDFGWIKVYEGEVIYWQPLPAWPALPLPVKEVEK